MNEDIENFELNRQKFDNGSNLCSMIRKDMIDEFIPYIQWTNISY